ncbi:MAG: hypothetical protein ACOYYF_03275, partial [Chloroflexota bacterium]
MIEICKIGLKIEETSPNPREVTEPQVLIYLFLFSIHFFSGSQTKKRSSDMKGFNSQKGQALILIAFGIVALIGFTA